MERSFSTQGWIAVLGVPALFISAFIIGASPKLMDLPLCAVRSFLHLDCPGCGLTRSIALLTHGQFRHSIDLNPMGVVIAVFFVHVFFKGAAGLVAGRKLKPLLQQKARDLILLVFVFALIAQWLFKLYFLLFTFNF